MEEWDGVLVECFNGYFNSFKELAEDKKKNFDIKKEHSFRVAGLSKMLALNLNLEIEEIKIAYFIGLFHDIGRFRQLVEFNTFKAQIVKFFFIITIKILIH